MPPPLSPQEQRAIRHYTNTGYARINRELRQRRPSVPTQRYVTFLRAALAKLPAYNGDVYRGVSVSNVRSLAKYRQVGSIVREDAFVSCTRSPFKAFSGNVRIYIAARSGRDISPWLQFPDEEEVLFEPGTRFRVLDFQTRGADIHIFLEEV